MLRKFFFRMTKRFHWPWIPALGIDNGFRESVDHEAPTSKFHYPYFFSDVMVVSYFLSCDECLSWAPDFVPILLERMHHRDWTALPYLWGRRLGTLCTRHGLVRVQTSNRSSERYRITWSQRQLCGRSEVCSIHSRGMRTVGIPDSGTRTNNS